MWKQQQWLQFRLLARSDYLVLRGAVYREEAALQWIQECIKLGEQRSAELKK